MAFSMKKTTIVTLPFSERIASIKSIKESGVRPVNINTIKY